MLFLFVDFNLVTKGLEQFSTVLYKETAPSIQITIEDGWHNGSDISSKRLQVVLIESRLQDCKESLSWKV